MIWTLNRYRLGETVTDGVLTIPDHERSYPTLERPWLPGPPGGVPFRSCVPDGDYQLVRFTRPNGHVVLQLLAAPLGVYDSQGDVPEAGGRYLVLIHRGNWVKDIAGCIAPGIERTTSKEFGPMVTKSTDAMEGIMAAYDSRPGVEPVTLKVITYPGARNL